MRVRMIFQAELSHDMVLMIIHIAAFTVGAVMGWLGFVTKKSGSAKFAAVLYLIGTICFPIFIIPGVPITVIGFVGGGRQKDINKMESTISK